MFIEDRFNSRHELHAIHDTERVRVQNIQKPICRSDCFTNFLQSLLAVFPWGWKIDYRSSEGFVLLIRRIDFKTSRRKWIWWNSILAWGACVLYCDNGEIFSVRGSWAVLIRQVELPLISLEGGENHDDSYSLNIYRALYLQTSRVWISVRGVSLSIKSSFLAPSDSLRPRKATSSSRKTFREIFCSFIFYSPLPTRIDYE